MLLCQCHNYKKIFECQLSIIIVNCFHVFVNEIPTLHAYIHWTPAFEGTSDACLFEIRDPHKFINSVMVYVHIHVMLIFHENIIHGNNVGI